MHMIYKHIGSTTNYHKYESKDTVGVLYVPRSIMPEALPEMAVTMAPISEVVS